MYYFGCWREAGHFLHTPIGNHVSSRAMPEDFPCALHVLDTGFLPPNQPEVEGRATLAHLNGWTIISFWDRSVDSRGKCNSAFLMRGSHSFEEACRQSKEAFPSIWARFKFEVKLP